MSTVRCSRCRAVLPADANFCVWCGAPMEPAPEWDATVGERLATALGPHYSLLGELGRGAFAIVYSVRDLRRGRYLAVKVMRPSLLRAQPLVERFRRETELVSQLDHPNILPVLFTGKSAGLVYYAMPRVQGETLRKRIDRHGPLPAEEAVRIFTEIARGLHCAHARGIVHRDVKPANILIDRAGRVRLADFGVAKALAAKGATVSLTGELIGTPEYMSPEQARGSSEIDHRCDIYSLGIVGFEMAVGHVPFAADTIQEVLHMQLEAPAPAMHAMRPDVPAALSSAIATCLAKDPRRRWQSAEAAANAAR